MASIIFYGWEVFYDEDHHLQADQTPKLGRLYTMYHGTTVQTARLIIKTGFKQSADGMLGPGVYVSRNQKKAERYPLKSPPTDRVVLKLSIDCGRVKKIDKDNHPLQKSWYSQGYDTAWVPPNCGMMAVPSGLEEDCVYDPQRIEVTDIALAPNTAILNELQQLIAQNKKGSSNSNSSGTCTVCKLKLGPAHAIQSCWGCGETICSFLTKHVCNR
ncbi:grass carp reovirus (GCRV)-induced gene 2p [Puntigrus tetrazona]|uniref:grass carp reovirus (GCRV)-induced gene 2p n=1 Tax=Puntigrus tetrazona TaxID=1606681 RepID=UPI001C8906F7|nr:grass carp reovirus (GCRV)-induced gene 2p [Puntigrus tetrazona]XP_043095372.1 grass carp reovirus (GCRV)-induced gene 2p [Puntigrus tetrazona]